MKVAITRTDIVDVEPARGAPLAHASAAEQLAAFRAAFAKSIFDDTVGGVFDTSDGDWEYAYTDHVSLQVELAPADPPPGLAREPEDG